MVAMLELPINSFVLAQAPSYMGAKIFHSKNFQADDQERQDPEISLIVLQS